MMHADEEKDITIKIAIITRSYEYVGGIVQKKGRKKMIWNSSNLSPQYFKKLR